MTTFFKAVQKVDIPSCMLKYFFAIIFICIFVALPFVIRAESKRAFKLLEKGDYGKLVELLDKSIEKDSVNAGAKYVYSLLFLTPKYREYNIDSSYYFINAAIVDFQIHDERMIDDLDKLGIHAESLQSQKSLVEQHAFRRAKAKNTIESKYFIGSLPGQENL